MKFSFCLWSTFPNWTQGTQCKLRWRTNPRMIKQLLQGIWQSKTNRTWSKKPETNCEDNPLSADPTKLSNTLKKFVGKSRRIVWVCLTIFWGCRFPILQALPHVTFSCIILENGQTYFKGVHSVFKVCLNIFQHYALKGWTEGIDLTTSLRYNILKT